MRKRAISRYVAAALSASMAAPAAAPAVQVFAKELSETADVTDSGKATPSDADPDDGDVLIADGDILPDDEEEATPSDAEEIIADVEIADSTQKKSDYPVFGTSAFWAWMDSLFTDKDEEGNVDLTSEDAKAAILAWHATIAKSSVATASDAEKECIAFGGEEGSDEFWDWFEENAVVRNEDGEIRSYKNDIIQDWIEHADAEDAYNFVLNLYMLRGVSTLSAIGSLWPDNYGAGADLYQHGNGTEESPYIIDSVEDLRFFAANIAQNLHNEDTFYRIEHGTYDLNGSWIPVGFQRNSGGDAVAFHGHITAEDGANIRNLGFKANTTLGITSSMAAEIQEQEAVGFFGEVGSGATITNLSIDTSRNTLEGSDYAGILAGHVVDATIKNCTVSGVVNGKGYVGGLVGFAESSTTQSGDRNTIIEDCKADKVAAYTNEAVAFTSEFLNGHSCVGGIVGFAANTSIIDTYVSTNTGSGNHIYGNGAYVGGVAGAIDHSDIYNTEVHDGEIGSNNSYAVGGIVGGYCYGHVKVARFSATALIPTSTNNYSAAFIGTRVNNAGFTYGADGDLAYLFADTKTKADTGICGSRVADDGKFGKDAHIGYWHTGDNYYTIVSGDNVTSGDQYFYKELENGILKIREEDPNGNIDTINHFTADAQGKPTRGFLLTIEDPHVSGTKAANISAYISGSYKPHVTSEDLGAFAPGDKVYVSFQALSDGTGYFQMDKTQANNPYINYHKHDEFYVYSDDTVKEGITEGAGYYFTMPDSDVTLGAIYKQVSQAVALSPSKIVFEVTQQRTGSREKPTIKYMVTAYNGNKDVDGSASIITDAKGNRWENRVVMTVDPDGTEHVNQEDRFFLNSLVNGADNDKFNLSWSTSNDEANDILSNMTVESGLTNGKSAYFTINLSDSAIADKAKELADKQKDGGYKDNMSTKSPYWYHSVISAKAQVDDSEDKTNPPIGYTDVDIKFNVDDQTSVSVTGAALTRNKITYNVVRTLIGDRKNPTVKYTVNNESPDSADEATAALGVTFNPSYFSNQDVAWYMTAVKENDLDESGEMTAEAKSSPVDSDRDKQDDGTLQVSVTGTGDNAYKDAAVFLKGVHDSACDNAWIKNLADTEDSKYTKENKKIPQKDYSMQKFIKVTGKDANNNSATDTCLVTVNFKTVDETEIMPAKVEINNKSNVKDYSVIYTFKGNSKTDVTARNLYSVSNGLNSKLSGGIGEVLSATVSPVYDPADGVHTPYDNQVRWSLQNGDITAQPNLDPYDVLDIDPVSGQITVRGYGESGDSSDMAYSPWIQDQISKGNLNGVTVTLNAVATSTRDNSKVDYVPIRVTFTAGSMSSDEENLDFDLVYTQNVRTSLAGTDVNETGGWSGTDPQTVTATATGTSEVPGFTVLNEDGSVNTTILTLSDTDNKNTKNVTAKTGAQWIKDIMANRKNGNSGSVSVKVQAKTTNGSSVSEVPVTVNFRYDGVDMDAATVSALPESYEASPDVITASTPENTYDTAKAAVKDRQITLGVVATQGNYSINNPGTRKWSYGIAKLSNTTYSSQGVKADDAVYELSGDIKDYCKVDKDGYLVPIKGLWDNVIASGKTNGSVSGVVTATKSVDGKTTSDSYKVTINFRYDKSVLESNEETFDVVYTDDSRTNSVKSHWTGDDKIQLKAHISDESGLDVTPVWETSDPDIVTVDADGRVSVNKDTWIADMIAKAQDYNEDTHSGSRTVTVTAKHPTTGATADTCQITVNFRYDKVIVDKTAETYNLIMTQTSRTNNSSYVWSGNDIRKINAKAFVEPGKSNKVTWQSEDSGILTVDDAGNIQPVVDAQWQLDIVAKHQFSGQKKVAAIAANSDMGTKDHANVTVNFQYEDVEMSENTKNMDVTITATGNRSYPTYTVTGATAADLSAVLNSANPNENGLKWTTSDAGLLSVDQNGHLTLVLPTDKDTNGKVVQAQGSKFSSDAHALIKEALKHAWTSTNNAITSGAIVISASSMDGRMADQCNVKLNIKYVDNTYTTSGGGGGGGSHSGGGGGGGSTKSTTPGGTKNATGPNLPGYVVKGGTWLRDNVGRWFFSTDHTYTDEWGAILNPYADTSKGQSQFDWFHFGRDSVMTTGWYIDANGDVFYLNPVSDNTLGRMLTGWTWIDDNGDGVSECYYFQEVSDGKRGRLYKGTTTPDGYTVNEKGQWTVNGVVQTKK